MILLKKLLLAFQRQNPELVIIFWEVFKAHFEKLAITDILPAKDIALVNILINHLEKANHSLLNKLKLLADQTLYGKGKYAALALVCFILTGEAELDSQHVDVFTHGTLDSLLKKETALLTRFHNYILTKPNLHYAVNSHS